MLPVCRPLASLHTISCSQPRVEKGSTAISTAAISVDGEAKQVGTGRNPLSSLPWEQTLLTAGAE